MILKINFKTIFINHGFKINFKLYLLTAVIKLIFKFVVDEYGFKKNSFMNILKISLYMAFIFSKNGLF